MFCSKCGKENEEWAKFCAKCGTAVNTPSVPNTPPPTEAFSSITNDVRTGNHEKADVGSLKMEEVPKNHKPVTPPPQQTIQPSFAPQYVPPQRNNLLIAMIVLSVLAIIVSGWVIINPYSIFFDNLADWFIYIILAVALAQGYAYPSNVLKIIAFIGLALKGSQCVWAFTNDNNWVITSRVLMVQIIIFAIIFLVLAIQLFIKNTGNGK
jgi:hypothetical protein